MAQGELRQTPEATLTEVIEMPIKALAQAIDPSATALQQPGAGRGHHGFEGVAQVMRQYHKAFQ